MKLQKNKQNLLISLLFVTILLVFIILKRESFSSFINTIGTVLRPVIIGLVLAYLCNPIFRLFERKLIFKVRPYGFRRALSLLFTYIVLGLIFLILLMLIVPQLIDSIIDFFGNYENLINTTLEKVNGLIQKLNTSLDFSIPTLQIESIQASIGTLIDNLDIDVFLKKLINLSTITSVWNVIAEVIYVVMDVIFGVFISIYILASKEKQYAQIMRIRKALFNGSLNERITNICTIADQSFGGFIRGKMLDSSIVGVLVYIIISIMNVPYALLIAVVIGITDFVPVIGPFIGVIPSAVIILLTDPIKVIPFLLCILIVQQIDGNIIAPKILGEHTGVSSLCVMIAITVMGAIWGLAGMVLGVPLFATILEIGGNYLNKRLNEKGLTINTDTDDAAREQAQKARRREKRYACKHPTCSGGKGSLNTEETRLLLSYHLAKKHNVKNSGDQASFSAFAAEYRKAVLQTATESLTTETTPEV